MHTKEKQEDLLKPKGKEYTETDVDDYYRERDRETRLLSNIYHAVF
jgi:tRNA G46 methylase TrmB